MRHEIASHAIVWIVQKNLHSLSRTLTQALSPAPLELKKLLTDRLTTVFVKQGKYAQEAFPENFSPDISVEHIGDLREFSAEQFLRA